MMPDLHISGTTMRGLGLVATGRRKIHSGKQFERYYPTNQLKGNDPILDNGDTYRTLELMEKIVRSTMADTAQIAPILKGNSLEQTCRNIWEHWYGHYQYKEDRNGTEQLRRPARSWKDRATGIDCDCFSIAISQCLLNLGIANSLRKATYDHEVGWQHVYVIVPKNQSQIMHGEKEYPRSSYIVIDCVVDQFNYEVPYLQKYDHAMRIQYLNGLQPMGEVPGAALNTYDPVLALLAEFNPNSLGSADGDATLLAYYEHLRNQFVHTRNSIQQYPWIAHTVGYDAPELIHLLDQVIANWQDPERVQMMVDTLARLEEQNGLAGSQLGGFFSKVRDAIKKVTAPVNNVIKKVAAPVNTALKNTATKVANVIADVGPKIQKYNPAIAMVRLGVLEAMKLNMFKQAQKLGYGYWTESQARAKGFDMAEWKKLKDRLARIERDFVGMGGDKGKLKAAIIKGWEKGVRKNNLVSGLGELVSTTAAITAATAALGLISQIIRDVNIAKMTKGQDDGGGDIPVDPNNIPQINTLVDPMAEDDDNTLTYILLGTGIVGLTIAAAVAIKRAKKAKQAKNNNKRSTKK